MNQSSRRIAHLDMDAFYASVELLRYPQLKGLPVVIAGRAEHKPQIQADGQLQFSRLSDYIGRGVITTSTYEARALGIYSAMGVMKAAQLAPQAILLPVDFTAYRHYSRLFKAAVVEIAPEIEDSGIDEIYIDLTTLADDNHTLAKRIKQAVLNATGLTCSIAITPNKLLAKIGSDLNKPDGVTILSAEDIPTRIWPLPARKINGIGPKAEKKLIALGITTIGQLAEAELHWLQIHFSHNYAIWLYEAARGIDDRPVLTCSEPKSVSRETTFERDLHPIRDRSILTAELIALCKRVANDLNRKAYQGRTIGIKIRFEDFNTITRDITLGKSVIDATAILSATRNCLRRVKLDKKIRLLGVRVSSLVALAEMQPLEDLHQVELPLSSNR
ncbi:MAG TPA: DNA polymerase IV [Nitrosomonas sp.]|nr:DNA polymerase IV [Nitrosomonas sp.]